MNSFDEIVNEDFLKEEIREDFFIKRSMKRFWTTNLRVLTIIKDICKKHGIKYFAAYGTLLGAVRHNGFIPWDDDIDLFMFRKDFIHFQKVALEEMPEGYCIKGFGNGYSPIKFVSNSDRIDEYEKRMKENFGCPYIVGIDIFCIDAIPDDKKERDFFIDVYGMVCDVADHYENYVKEETAAEYLAKIEEFLNCKIDRTGDVKLELWKLSEQLAGIYMDDDTKEVSIIYRFVTNDYKSETYKREYFSDAIEVPFENISVSIPNGYSEILKEIYGEDYMIPKKNFAGHTYPCFLNQKEYLEKKFGIKLED